MTLRLENHWYIAAAASELGSVPIRREVEGETLALFRDEHGRPHAVVDRCAHRGMALTQGRVKGGCLECPYHGWRYDGSGHLAEVPALDPDQPRPRASIRSFPVEEVDEQLWVWIGHEAPTHPVFRFPHHQEPGWSSFFMQTRFDAEVEDCLENFLDVPHTLHVHPGLFRSEATRPTRARVLREGGSVVAEFLEESPLEGWGPRLVFPSGTSMHHTDRFLLPAITRVDYRFGPDHSFVITSQCTQRTAEGDPIVDVTTHITWRLPRWGWLARPFLRWYCRRVIQQDVDTLAVIGRQSRQFGRSHVHTEADLLGRHISRLRRDDLAGRVTEPHVAETTLRI